MTEQKTYPPTAESMRTATESGRNLHTALKSGGPYERAGFMRRDLRKAAERCDHMYLVDLLTVCMDTRFKDDESISREIRTHAGTLQATLLEFPLQTPEQWLALQRCWEEVVAADATSSGGWQWGDPHMPRASKLEYPRTRYEPQRDTHGWIILDADAKKNALAFIEKHLTRSSQLPENVRASMERQIRSGRTGLWNKDYEVTSLSVQGDHLRMQLGGIAYMLVLIEQPS